MSQANPDIRAQIAQLEAQKEAIEDRIKKAIAEAQAEKQKIKEQLRAVVDACPKTSGKKWASGGCGKKEHGGYWLECAVCGQTHVLTRSEFDAYPGEIKWVGNGN